MIRCDSFSELPGIHLGKLTVEDAMLKNSSIDVSVLARE